MKLLKICKGCESQFSPSNSQDIVCEDCNIRIVSFICPCSYISGIKNSKCWKCGRLKDDQCIPIRGNDMPTGSLSEAKRMELTKNPERLKF
jgi:hypothetical protein